MSDDNNWKHLNMRKLTSSGSFKNNVTYTLFGYKYIYTESTIEYTTEFDMP